MLRLLDHKKVPPAGYYYIQTEGIRKAFGATPEIRTLAKRIAAFRRSNNLPRATEPAALEDVDVFTANRLGRCKWTFDPDNSVSFAQLHPEVKQAAGGCPTCGLPLITG